MIQEIDFSATNDVIIDGNSMDVVNLNNNNIWNKHEPIIFAVRRYTSEDSGGKTTGEVVTFKVTAGESDALVEYGGIVKTIPAGTTATVTFGNDGTTDDGTPVSGNITFSGDVANIAGVTWSTGSKGTTSGYGCITGVVSWGGLTQIGQYLFSNATLSVVDFTMSNRITYIDSWAFFKSNIETVKLPKYYTSFNTEVFQNTKIKSFEFPEWADVLPYGLFANCSQLKSIFIPKTIKGWKASQGVAGTGTTFQGSGLESVEFELPCSLTSIAAYAFAETKSLMHIDVPEGITSLGVTSFWGSAIASIKLPSTLLLIDASAFKECTNLTTITIPASANKIDRTAFKGSGVKTIIFENPNGWVDSSGNSVDLSNPEANATDFLNYSGGTAVYYTRS